MNDMGEWVGGWVGEGCYREERVDNLKHPWGDKALFVQGKSPMEGGRAGAKATCLGGWVGGWRRSRRCWTYGWVGGWMEEKQAGMRCCGFCMGWVGGWVGGCVRTDDEHTAFQINLPVSREKQVVYRPEEVPIHL